MQCAIMTTSGPCLRPASYQPWYRQQLCDDHLLGLDTYFPDVAGRCDAKYKTWYRTYLLRKDGTGAPEPLRRLI